MVSVFLVFGTNVKGGVEHRRADPIRQRRSTGGPAEKSVAVSQQVRGFKRIQAFNPAMKARSAICAVLPAMMISPTHHRQCVSTGVQECRCKDQTRALRQAHGRTDRRRRGLI
jgi:hypothetical protein